MSYNYSDTYWMTVPEAAAHMGVSTKTVRNYIGKGYLKAHRFGPRSIRISTDELDALYVPYGNSYERTF